MTAKVYVIAQFKAKSGKEAELFEVLKALEADSLREEGCIQYRVTRQINHECATQTDYSIVFNEIWANAEAWSAHGKRQQIKLFFEQQVKDEMGLVEDVIVTAYSDEGHAYDKPIY